MRGASFRVEKGETHCLVGESGCGKSVTALAVMSLLARGGQRSAKRMSFAGTDLLSLSDREMARLRGNRMAMIFQEPMTSLNPAFTIGSQMAEVLTRHKGGSRAAALDRAAELMGRVGITAPGMRLGQFPHQLSGGLRQRVMIAMALMCDPELLIADEPTTALDVTVQAQILRLLANLKRELGLSILLITHDLGIVARVADRVSVMYAGEVVERAPTAELFRAPQAPLYARPAVLRAGAGPRAARQAARLDPGRGAGDRRRALPAAPSARAAPTPTRPARTKFRAGRRATRTTIFAGSRRTGRSCNPHDRRDRGREPAVRIPRPHRLDVGGKARGRGRRRLLQRAGRQRARHRRRVRLRQIHARAPDPRAAQADGGRPCWSTASACSTSTARRAPG